MRSIFFAPHGEPAPVKSGELIFGGKFFVGKFLGNFETPGWIGWEFEVMPYGIETLARRLNFNRAEYPSQWAEVRQAG